MSEARSSRTRAVLAFVAVVGSLGAAFGACSNYQRNIGEQCIKDVDCISGFCLDQVCAEPNPTLSGSSYGDAGSVGIDTGSITPTPEASTTSDTGPAPGVDAQPDSPAAGDDANSGGDAQNVQPNDGSGTDGAEMDASDDAPNDAPAIQDATDATDAFNQMSRRRTFVA